MRTTETTIAIISHQRLPTIAANTDIAPDPPQPTRWEQTDPDVRLMLRFKNSLTGNAKQKLQGEQAFEELVQRNVGKVHGIVYRVLGGNAQVEDLAQEVFLRVHRTAPRYVPAAKFSTWLYRITANLCFNVMRSSRKGRSLQIDGRDGEDGDGFFRALPDRRHGSPHDSMDAGELRETVAAAIGQLPETQKIAIILNKYEDKSYQDIADILDCSPMAVKSLLSRARDNLRRSLQEYIREE